MKRLTLCFLTLFALVASAFAQTPEEIIANMDKAFAPVETQGMSMALDVKIPILGTSPSKVYILGNKERSETTILNHRLITFMDGNTIWEYDTVSKEIKIKDAIQVESDAMSEADLFSDILAGYDVSLKEETAEAWHLVCKKSKNNKEKDDPGKMDLVISKATNLPISLTAKVSGITITMHDIKIGIDPNLVTFDVNDFPDAKIIDERKK